MRCILDADAWRALIVARIEALTDEAELGRAGTGTVTLDQQAVGRLSRMDALQNQAMAKAQQTRRARETARLREALRRLESEDFGWCEDCGDAIPEGRLRLDPAAALCVSCASG